VLARENEQTNERAGGLGPVHQYRLDELVAGVLPISRILAAFLSTK
jgi:hypothetical protein